MGLVEIEFLVFTHQHVHFGDGYVSFAALLGDKRTATQNLEFVLLELVEIAVGAFSPGINDPFTANTCVDRLTEALYRVADKADPEGCSSLSSGGKLRHMVRSYIRRRGSDTEYSTTFRPLNCLTMEKTCQ